jgi:hypothetical protein
MSRWFESIREYRFSYFSTPLALPSPYPRIVTRRWGGRPSVAAAHRIVQAIEETIVLILCFRTAFGAFSALLDNCNVNNLPVFMSAEESKSTPRNQPQSLQAARFAWLFSLANALPKLGPVGTTSRFRFACSQTPILKFLSARAAAGLMWRARTLSCQRGRLPVWHTHAFAEIQSRTPERFSKR